MQELIVNGLLTVVIITAIVLRFFIVMPSCYVVSVKRLSNVLIVIYIIR